MYWLGFVLVTMKSIIIKMSRMERAFLCIEKYLSDKVKLTKQIRLKIPEAIWG